MFVMLGLEETESPQSQQCLRPWRLTADISRPLGFQAVRQIRDAKDQFLKVGRPKSLFLLGSGLVSFNLSP